MAKRSKSNPHKGEDAVLNPRQEIILSALLAGKTQIEAAEEAGVTAQYVSCLLTRETKSQNGAKSIQRFRKEYAKRLAEQRERLMEKADITKESLLDELVEISRCCKQEQDRGNWIKTVSERAKLLGFYPGSKVELEHSGNVNVTAGPQYDFSRLTDKELATYETLEAKLTGGPAALIEG